MQGSGDFFLLALVRGAGSRRASAGGWSGSGAVWVSYRGRVSAGSPSGDRPRARAEGIEPPTAGFGDRCSTKLSYARNRRASESPRPIRPAGVSMEKGTARGGKLAAGRVRALVSPRSGGYFFRD